jgi:hypothetical protein
MYKTRANIERIVPKILDYVAIGHSYLVAGHGAHTRSSDYFTVPDGKYVIFLSNPGVSLSGQLINDPKFQSMLQNKTNLAQFFEGTLNRNKVPNFLRYSRTNFNWKKTLYSPRTRCPNLHLQFWDNTEPLNANGKGILQPYMGVWTLPEFGIRRYLNQVKTLRDIVRNGPNGVYLVYSCRITPGNINWSSVREVHQRARTVLPNLQSFTNWLGNRMNTNNMKNNYLTNVRTRLQNVGRLHLAPVRTARAQNIQQRESETFRSLFTKRKGTNNTGPSAKKKVR